jgi:fumarate hydratase class I
MTVIKQDDLIQSVADALQFISYYHPVDFIQAMHEAYLREESPAARDSIAQILINSRMCATGHRPICQDTGIVTVFVRVGMDVRWDGATMSLDDMINEGVRRAYNLPENVLRASILADPAGARKTPRTTPRRSSTTPSSRATPWKWTWRPRAAVPRTSRKWPCSTRPTRSSTGC